MLINIAHLSAAALLCEGRTDGAITVRPPFRESGKAVEIRTQVNGGPSLLDMRLLVKNEIQQRLVHFNFAVVADETQFSKPVHEEAHPRPRSADHFGQRLLTDMTEDRFRFSVFAEMCE